MTQHASGFVSRPPGRSFPSELTFQDRRASGFSSQFGRVKTLFDPQAEHEKERTNRANQAAFVDPLVETCIVSPMPRQRLTGRNATHTMRCFLVQFTLKHVECF